MTDESGDPCNHGKSRARQGSKLEAVKNNRLAIAAREGPPSTLEEEPRGEGGDRTSCERQTHRRSDLPEASPLG